MQQFRVDSCFFFLSSLSLSPLFFSFRARSFVFHVHSISRTPIHTRYGPADGTKYKRGIFHLARDVKAEEAKGGGHKRVWAKECGQPQFSTREYIYIYIKLPNFYWRNYDTTNFKNYKKDIILFSWMENYYYLILEEARSKL